MNRRLKQIGAYAAATLLALLYAEGSFAREWSRRIVKDELTDEKTAIAKVASHNTFRFAFPYHGNTKAYLYVIDDAASPGVLFGLDRGQILCSTDCTLVARFDDGEPVALGARHMFDHDSRGVVLSDPRGFLAQAIKAKRVRIGFTAYREGTPVAEFRYSKPPPISKATRDAIASATKPPPRDDGADIIAGSCHKATEPAQCWQAVRECVKNGNDAATCEQIRNQHTKEK
jgi:hypothetical protein